MPSTTNWVSARLQAATESDRRIPNGDGEQTVAALLHSHYTLVAVLFSVLIIICRLVVAGAQKSAELGNAIVSNASASATKSKSSDHDHLNIEIAGDDNDCDSDGGDS